jgi:hypothetical protein
LKSTNEFFDSPGWEAIREELDQVPIFAVANAEGQPLKYSIQLAKKSDDGDDTFEVPLFFTHVEDALKELENARKNTPLPGMDMYVWSLSMFVLDIFLSRTLNLQYLIRTPLNTSNSPSLYFSFHSSLLLFTIPFSNPYPLGGLFEMWSKNEAVIVPNKMSIISAGAPPTANPMGQVVPLFACMEIAQEDEDGKAVLPLFFELEDANAAVAEAVSLDGGKTEDFEVVGLSLPQAVQLLSQSKENAFQFIPPSSSIKHIRDYLSG